MDQDNVAHAEMKFGQDWIMIGSEWSEAHKSPKSVEGKNTQSVHLQLARGDDLDAHCDRARQAGAAIVQEPETQFYGDRVYRARDLEGHIWTVSVTIKDMKPEEWDRASGLKTVTRLD